MAHQLVKIGLVVYLMLWVGIVAASQWFWPMSWPANLLTFAGVAYLGLTGAVAVHAACTYRFGIAGALSATRPEAFSPGLRRRIADECPAFEALGLQLQAHIAMDAKVQGVSNASLVFTDPKRTLLVFWSMAESEFTVNSSIEIVTYSIRGECITTAQENGVLPIMLARYERKFPQVADLPGLLELHRHRVSFHFRTQPLATIPAGEELVAWMNDEHAKEQTRKAGLGFYKQVANGAAYRPTLWFGWPSALCGLPPLRWVPRRWQQWQGAKEIGNVGWIRGHQLQRGASPALVTAQKKPWKGWGKLFFLASLVTVVFAYALTREAPTPAALSYTEGQVVSAKWVGARHPKFVVGVANSPLRFQPIPPEDAATHIEELIKPGMVARIAHTRETVGMFGLNDSIAVYALWVDGEVIYSFEEYRRRDNLKRRNDAGMLVGASVLMIFSYWRLRCRPS